MGCTSTHDCCHGAWGLVHEKALLEAPNQASKRIRAKESAMKRDPQAFFQVVQIMTGVFAASIFFQTLSSGGTIQELLFPLAVSVLAFVLGFHNMIERRKK